MRDTFRRSGDVGRNLLAVDWAATPLGPLESWPNSLQAAVRIVLSSRFSMWMAWGPELTFFCNDAYRRDTLGAKYPWALGQARPDGLVGDLGRHRASRRPGHGVGGRDVGRTAAAVPGAQRLHRGDLPHVLLQPARRRRRHVAGLLCVVSEDTEEVIAHRRMQTLRDLGQPSAGSNTVAETVRSACTELARQLAGPALRAGLPLRRRRGDRPARRLHRLHRGPPGRPARRCGRRPRSWPVPETRRGHAGRARAASAGCRPAGGRPTDQRAAVVPIVQGGGPAVRLPGHGAQPFRLLDDGYADFLGLVAGQLASGRHGRLAFEFEQRRAETLAELDQAKTDFFTNVSHEFRTPLTLLLGPAEDALADAANPLRRRAAAPVEVIHRNGQRLLKLVNTLLDFSRLDSGRVEASFEPVRPRRATPASWPACSSPPPSGRPDADRRLPALPEPVYVDRDHVGQGGAEPALERVEVHLRGRRSRSRCARRTARRCCRSPTPAPGSRRRTRPTSSSGSTGSAAPGRAPTRARASGSRWSRRSRDCTAATSTSPAAPGEGSTFRCGSLRQRPPLRRTTSSRRRHGGRPAGRRRLPGRGVPAPAERRAADVAPGGGRRLGHRAPAAGAGRRRQRRHPRLRRRACSPPSTTSARPSTAATAWSRRSPTRRTWCSPT